jgi:hypothetical protein
VLAQAGLEMLESSTYLDSDSCRYWDRLDLLGALGRGRYRVAPAAHRVASRMLPAGPKRRLKEQIARRLLGRAGHAAGGSHCAAVLIAAGAQ